MLCIRIITLVFPTIFYHSISQLLTSFHSPLILLLLIISDAYCFQNAEVQVFFDIMRNIYRKDYKKMEEVYGNREISTELGLAIGAAAESKKLMNKALKKTGGVMNVCTVLKELEDEGRKTGKREGKIEGIVKTCKDFGVSEETAAKKLQKECGLNAKDARKYVIKYYL